MKRLAEHFAQGRLLAEENNGFVVKVIGDAFMVAFPNSTYAVKFAIEFSTNTAVDFIGIRVGINSGEVTIHDNDIYGLDVNKAARIVSMPPEEGIYLSESVQKDYVNVKGSDTNRLFQSVADRPGNFPKTRIWRIYNRELKEAYVTARRSRQALLGEVKKTGLVMVPTEPPQKPPSLVDFFPQSGTTQQDKNPYERLFRSLGKDKDK